MPNSGNLEDHGNHYYSFDYKGVHYVTIDWDHVFYLKPEDKLAALSWLRNDLEKAHINPAINFKVFYSHRPFYCPQADGDHCKIFFHTKPFQDVMTKYGIDLYLNSHTHQYYRLKKQMDLQNYSGKSADRLPLIIITGANGTDTDSAAADEPQSNHIYAPDMADYMYTEETDPDFQSAYLELLTTPTKISGQLIRSSDLKVLDSFELPKMDRSSAGDQLIKKAAL